MSSSNVSQLANSQHYHFDIEQDVTDALLEDLGIFVSSTKATAALINCANDITASLISEEKQVTAFIVAKEPGVLCGIEWARKAFQLIDSNIQQTWFKEDGDILAVGDKLVSLTGSARHILIAERTALNFLQMLSGTATTTASYVKCLDGSNTKLLDTRKTIPGFRQAQKYAVVCGGGVNHRIGLYDAYLIKENHINACGGIANAVSTAKSNHPNKPVEVEVESIEELQQAIAAKADIVMLDNFSNEQIQEAVSLNNGRCKLEVSGNITDDRLAVLAKFGVDYVSSGAITKNVSALDLSLLIE